MMNMIWFAAGITLGCLNMWLQWLQVKNVIPERHTSRTLFSLLYPFRLILFVISAGIAMRENYIYGLFYFAGFWTARSILLILIGSGRVNCFPRRNS